MTNLFSKIKFLFAAIVTIAFLYAGLTLTGLQNHAQAQGNDTQIQMAKLNQDVIVLQTQLDNLKNNTATNVIEKPVVQTQVVTRTEIKEIEKKVAPQATVTIQNIGSFKIDISDSDSAFTITKKAAEQNGFGFEYQQYSFGAMITSIGKIKPVGNQYWAFYFNGAFSNVGASDQLVKKDDTVFWQLASF